MTNVCDDEVVVTDFQTWPCIEIFCFSSAFFEDDNLKGIYRNLIKVSNLQD